MFCCKRFGYKQHTTEIVRKQASSAHYSLINRMKVGLRLYRSQDSFCSNQNQSQAHADTQN